MKEATVIFPHQLYRNHPGLSRNRDVYLVEDQLFFSDFHYPMRFHKQKLLLHRASMKACEADLTGRGFRVHYLEHAKDPDMAYLFGPLNQAGVETMYLVEPTDFILEKRLRKGAEARGIRLEILTTPGFLSEKAWLEEFFAEKDRYSQSAFYIAQRKKRGILLEDGKPKGGKWSFDPENRGKLPANIIVPAPWFPAPNRFVKEAGIYVEEHFGNNPGSCRDFHYPVTHGDAKRCLDDFLKNRLQNFGTYQDAISSSETILFHSVLSPALNIGLLTPAQVVDETLDFARNTPVPLNSLEGFIRQVIGWREFIRALYLLEGVKQRTTNFWKHERKMPDSFYEGTTGVDPVDTVIGRVLKYAYAHHIERLMVIGNFLLLCEVDPDDVYYWFMDLFIDSYDWVMVPNVYGMSQHADGGLMTTKPYICSSSYIRKMSDFSKGPWCDTLDGLYWRFIHKHRDFFASSPRMSLMAAHLKKMPRAKLKKHLATAERFLEIL